MNVSVSFSAREETYSVPVQFLVTKARGFFTSLCCHGKKESQGIQTGGEETECSHLYIQLTVFIALIIRDGLVGPVSWYRELLTEIL